jgi:hypothetical protein
MVFQGILAKYAKSSPVSVMVRGTLENVFSQHSIDDIFAATAERQYAGELLFSSVVDVLSLTVCGKRKSVREAFLGQEGQLTVSIKSVYNKLNGAEPAVSRALVKETSPRLHAVVRYLNATLPAPFPGFRTKIIDGNHLAATDQRLLELRSSTARPLPGHALVVLEPEVGLMTDVFPCEDAYAQERSLFPQVLETVEPKDVWIADRNFCTTDFLFGIASRGACFVIREHAANANWEAVGKRRCAGETDTGMVYEQRIRLLGPDGTKLEARRVTVVLKQPTQNGETEVHVLSNLPKRVKAANIADGYLGRWSIENAFQELEQALQSEIRTLAYPRAALLSFCVALLAYNTISIVKAALRSVHGDAAAPEKLSGYLLAAEVSTISEGMKIAVSPENWRRTFSHLSERELAAVLRQLAEGVRPARFKKQTHGPKKAPPKRTHGKRRPHVATARVLATRRALAKYRHLKQQ